MNPNIAGEPSSRVMAPPWLAVVAAGAAAVLLVLWAGLPAARAADQNAGLAGGGEGQDVDLNAGRELICSPRDLRGFALSVAECGELVAATAEALGLPEAQLVQNLALAATQLDREKSPFRLLLQLREELQLDMPEQWLAAATDTDSAGGGGEDDGGQDVLQELDEVLQRFLGTEPPEVALAGPEARRGGEEERRRGRDLPATSSPRPAAFLPPRMPKRLRGRKWCVAPLLGSNNSNSNPLLQLAPAATTAQASISGRGNGRIGKREV